MHIKTFPVPLRTPLLSSSPSYLTGCWGKCWSWLFFIFFLKSRITMIFDNMKMSLFKNTYVLVVLLNIILGRRKSTLLYFLACSILQVCMTCQVVELNGIIPLGMWSSESIICHNELRLIMSWVGCLLKDSELFILFAENRQILLKISFIPIFLTFI